MTYFLIKKGTREMKIDIEIKEELPNGGAIAEVTFDKDGLEVLVQHGMIDILSKAIEEEKKCLKNSMKNTPVRWLKKWLKSLGTNSPSLKSEKQWQPLTTTSATGKPPTPKKSTSHTPRHGSTKAVGMTKSKSPK
tara:strand:+ start:564 stop:968 length:405 start_codon:yes stop_codon:yes gene_type:complete